ncbi:DUF2058 family protein [Wohlfahrtiimonas larvae]|uniref:DUF2058 domain-containing protein n=1 Tax=Wohlfahrtiimonas larvae TaxID=1157986 RepID=A0ABP9MLU3_9GAMM|nr:DUF2058 family protein [Wohlfahrtiimonas larvae]
MSLRDQLLKAGVVSEDRAKKVEQEKKKTKHQSYRDKDVKAKLDAEKKAQQDAILASEKAQKAKSQESNHEVSLKQRRKALRIEARRIIDQKRVNVAEANDQFNFSSDGKKIRYVSVTAEQRKQLGNGQLAICRNDRDGFDYPLIPKENALRLVEIEKLMDERWVYLLIDPQEVVDNADEWAAWDAYEAELAKEKNN